MSEVYADSKSDTSILVRLKEVGVMIGLDATISKTGVTADILRPQIENKLREAHFQIIPEAEVIKSSMETPTLIVRFRDTKILSGALAYDMQLILRRGRLTLGNDGAPKHDYASWSITRGGSIATGDTAKLQNVIAAGVDEFLAAHHTVNASIAVSR